MADRKGEGSSPSPAAGGGFLPAASETRRLSRLVVGLAVALVVLFAGAVLGTYLLNLNRYVERSGVAADLIEDSVTRTLESVETTLLAVLAAARDASRGNPAAHDAPLRAFMNQSMRFAPHLRQIVLADDGGRILVDSTAGSEGAVLDLKRMGLGAAEGGEGPLVRGLRLGRESAGRFLPLVGASQTDSVRRVIPVMIEQVDGLSVVGAINPVALDRTLRHALTGSSRTVRLVRLSGETLVSVKRQDGACLASDAPPLMDVAGAGRESGAVRIPSDIGPLPEGWLSFRLSARYPVSVVVCTATRHTVTQWIEDTGVLLFWSAVALLALLAGVALFMREALRRTHLEQSLRLIGLTRAVFAHSAEPMLVTDPQDRILAANPAFLTATALDGPTITGAAVTDFLVPAWAPAELDENTPDSSALTSSRLEHWWLRCPGGSPRAVEYRSAPLDAESTIITLNDITERIETQNALQDALEEARLANRAKSEFLAAMSHELRTPLNAILGFSEILRDQFFGPLGSRRYINYAADIHASGAHLRDIINDLLDLARIEAGRLEAVFETLDLNEEIETCCRLVKERATNHGLCLTTPDRIDPALLNADRRLFRQMMINLLSNAIKFTPRGGWVRVEARRDAVGTLRVSVSDSGIGIAPEDQPRIFESYQRAANTEIRRIEGSGLGLSLVKAMMELHGGAVTVHSMLGQGSTFTLIFPAQTEPDTDTDTDTRP